MAKNFKSYKSKSIISKSAARIAVVQIIYNCLLSSKDSIQVTEEYTKYFKNDLENEFNIDCIDEEYLNLIINNFDYSLEKKIEKYLVEGWTLERMSNVDKSILFAGIIELNLDLKPTKNTIISEYIEIAFQMGGEPKFVNKILDKIASETI
jgi:transcription termination factor NusB